jgi:ketosteroid isomerase-like protein
MRPFCRTLLIAVTFAVAGISETSAEVTSGLSLTEDEAAVIRAEDDWIQAELSKDAATLRRVIDDQFVINSNNGTTAGREDLIDGVLSWNMTGQTISERTVSVVGDTAVIFGTTELRFASENGEESVSLLRYTSTYVRRGEQWRAIALHMSPRASSGN